MEPNTPLDKRRVLLYAISPVVLLALLAIGMRMATVAAERQAAQADARDRSELNAQQNNLGQMKRAIPPPPAFRNADKATQASVELAVRGQIQAMQAGDFNKALQFSVPGFRSQTTPEQFGQLIRSGYAPLMDAESVALKQARVVQSDAPATRASVETVVLIGTGQKAYYTYMLEKKEGTWGVQGVMGHPGPESPVSRW